MSDEDDECADAPPPIQVEPRATRVGRRGGVLQQVKRELVPLAGYDVQIPAGAADTLWEVWDRQPACGSWPSLNMRWPSLSRAALVSPAAAATTRMETCRSTFGPDVERNAESGIVGLPEGGSGSPEERQLEPEVTEPDLELQSHPQGNARSNAVSDMNNGGRHGEAAYVGVACAHCCWLVGALIMCLLTADLFPSPWDVAASALSILLAFPVLLFRLVTMRISIAKKLLTSFQTYLWGGTAVLAVFSHVLAQESVFTPGGFSTLGVMLCMHACVIFSDSYLHYRAVFVKGYYVAVAAFSVASIVLASHIPTDVTFMLWVFRWSAVQSALDGNLTVIFFAATSLLTLFRDDTTCVLLSAPYTMTITGLQGRRFSEDIADADMEGSSKLHVLSVRKTGSDSSSILYNHESTLLSLIPSSSIRSIISYVCGHLVVRVMWAVGSILLICVIFGLLSSWYTVLIIIVLKIPNAFHFWALMNTDILWNLICNTEIMFLQLRGLYGYISLMYLLRWDIRSVPLFPAYLSYSALFFVDAMHHSLRRIVKLTIVIPFMISLILLAFTLMHSGNDRMFTIGIIEYTATQVSFDVFKTIAFITFKNAIHTWLNPSRYSTVRTCLYRII